MKELKTLAIQLLEWNKENLKASTTLFESDLATCFADEFVVKANGLEYKANHHSYLEFLNGFKANIESICYKVQEYLCDADKVVTVMSAKVRRIDGSIEAFEAMLLLKFDENDLITLWQEVYAKKI
ncbi:MULTISPECIES: hypothetical protein [Aliivibrio]|jgi:hypothetical protein|uniref:SnoaL-like domain-containing protein n=2 Tax=Aliivibrio logei TaxID=688 RepID=A0A1B9P096_ALILO|nr:MULTISPECIES: hypothetical protein [Aliivibrio]MBB1315556.1 hypothetical protein [Aliivibrio sp. SR45-2]OCH21787.1 hypothetical protein A6E04_07965 [Aliivibrio logei]OEF10755.1 hypothetical protein A1Q5_13015 [Aliivibrio logei 5S-186]